MAEKRHYSDQDRDKGLVALIAHGSPARACDALREGGLTISPALLSMWRQRHHDRYHELAQKYGPQLEQQMVVEARETITLAAAVERKALERLHGEMSQVDRKDLGNVAANAAKVKTYTVDKVLLPMTGRPSVITENRTAADILERIAEIAPGLVIDGEAVEDSPKQLPAAT